MTRGNAISTFPSDGAAGPSNNKATGSPGTSTARAAFANSASSSTPTENQTGSQSKNSADSSHSLTGSRLSVIVTPPSLVMGARAHIFTPGSDVTPPDKDPYGTPSLGLLDAVCRGLSFLAQNIIGRSPRIRNPTTSLGVAA